MWATFNEPWIVSMSGYGEGYFPPGGTGIGTDVYVVTHNLIKSHARAYRMYHEEFAPTQNGKCHGFIYVNNITVVDSNTYYSVSKSSLEK